MATDWTADTPGYRHPGAAATAIVLSLVFHVLFYVRVPGISLSGSDTDELLAHKRRAHSVRVVHPRIVDNEPIKNFFAENPTAFSESRHAAVPEQETFDEILEPRSVPGEELLGDDMPIEAPAPAPQREEWNARAQIIQVENAVVSETLTELPRREIPRLARTIGTPDITLPVDRDAVRLALASGRKVADREAPRPTFDFSVNGGRTDEIIPEIGATAPMQKVRIDIEDKYEELTRYKPIEDLLLTDIRLFSAPRDPDYAYLRVSIDRAGAAVLEALPKDILLVQDCSASMTEQRLYYCRQGLERCLGLIGPKDRFNVIRFRQSGEYCFQGFTANSDESRARAAAFIKEMKALGNTDIEAASKEWLTVKRDEGRPLIVLVVTDGLATAGITDNASIIEGFSDANRGGISVFTIGTVRTANKYLLDLLSYRNRGDSVVVHSGRWDIPDEIVRRMDGVRRPTLSDVRFLFAGSGSADVYPALTTNLYADRPLTLYARVRKDLSRLVFQVVGQAGDATCDMVFNIDLADAKSGGKELRENWAWQRIYHLIGEHTRTGDPEVVREIHRTAREYSIRVPYSRQLKRMGT